MQKDRTSWFWLSAALAVVAGGCADTATCDPNEILYAGRCMPIPMMAEPDAASVDESSQMMESADAGAGDASDEH